jgi:protein-disulfide isomerase
MSAVELGKLCPLCVGLYGVNVALFAMALFSHPAGPKGGFKASFGAPKTGAFWLTIALAGIAVIGTQAVYSVQANDALALAKQRKTTPPLPIKVDIELGESPGRGPAKVSVVVVEFSDFECPHCKRLSQALKEAAAREPSLFRYHFKHYPMDSSCNDTLDGVMHERACAAAVAMVCAQRQGRAWEMHDRLFLNQRALGPAEIETYALSIGVDIEVFRACQQDKSALEAVRRDIAEGNSLGVQGTPTWFANGMREVGARDPDDLIGIFRHTKRVAEKEKEKEKEKAKPPTHEATPDPEKGGP